MMDPTPPLKAGDKFLKYEIVRLLDSGGHAFVFEALDPYRSGSVAIKLVPSVSKSGRSLALRAQSEARVLHRIDHPNVVTVYDADRTDAGDVYLVMEKLEGRTLRGVLRELGRLTVPEALLLAVQAADGLAAAHAKDVVHRDIKPENLFVTANNRLKVFDFGIAKVGDYAAHKTTDKRVLQGTLIYMSPEHLQGHSVTVRSDVFALGTVLYEALYQHPATLNPNVHTPQQAAWMQMTQVPPMLHELDPSIPRYVARFVQRAVAKDPEQRYASMADMSKAARELLQRLAAEVGEAAVRRSVRDLVNATADAPGHERPVLPLSDGALPSTSDSSDPGSESGASVANRPAAVAARAAVGAGAGAGPGAGGARYGQPTPLLGSAIDPSPSLVRGEKTAELFAIDSSPAGSGAIAEPAARFGSEHQHSPEHSAVVWRDTRRPMRYAADSATTTYDRAELGAAELGPKASGAGLEGPGPLGEPLSRGVAAERAAHEPPLRRAESVPAHPPPSRSAVAPALALAAEEPNPPHSPTTNVPVSRVRPAGVPAPLFQGARWKWMAAAGTIAGLGLAVGWDVLSHAQQGTTATAGHPLTASAALQQPAPRPLHNTEGPAPKLAPVAPSEAAAVAASAEIADIASAVPERPASTGTSVANDQRPLATAAPAPKRAAEPKPVSSHEAEAAPPVSKYQRRLDWLERDLKTDPSDRLGDDAPSGSNSWRTK